MILVDTSVWIDHLHQPIPRLADLLLEGKVVTHAFVEGELASGTLRRRAEVLRAITRLPRTSLVEHEHVRRMNEEERLYGRGIGWIDIHLVASARAGTHRIWTHDARLERVARQLGLAA
ncbi:MAG: type II toxin-antitoxin system VapC family toxin [Planctomycetes bacterium]|nr:type II toxin-antitoxin system VapC family toxin [Planctomycetota bacterium]